MKEEIDVVIAGGASHVVTLAGGCSELSLQHDIVRIGGASAGAIRAAGEAFAIPVDEQKKLMNTVLMNNHLKDRALNPFDRFGLYKGDNLLAALKEVFTDARMGDAFIPLRIVVCDLYTRQPVTIDSTNPQHVKLKVVDVLRCSAAIPVFFKAWTLPEVWGSRLFVDGGTSANFAMSMFDDSERRTVGLRLKPRPPEVKPVQNIPSFVEALAEIIMWASDNAYISKKLFSDVIQLPQLGSGLDFALTPSLIAQRWEAGVVAVKSALAAKNAQRD